MLTLPPSCLCVCAPTRMCVFVYTTDAERAGQDDVAAAAAANSHLPVLGRKSMPHMAAAGTAAAAAARAGGSNGVAQPPPAAAAAAGSSAAGAPGSTAAAAAAAVGRSPAAQGPESSADRINRSISAGAALGSAAAAESAAAAAASGSADGSSSGGEKCKDTLEGHASGDEAEVEGFAADDDGFDFDEPETMHRLCPTYASDINSPLR